MYFDTHAHLDQSEFSEDRADVVARARKVGVNEIVIVGVTPESSRKCVELAAHYKLYATVGIQPNYVAEMSGNAWDEIVALAGKPGVVALGETGLDRYWDDSSLPVQQDYFDRHLRLAQQLSLPVVIHLRNSEQEILEMLREARSRGPLSGVMHSYTGTLAGALECIEMGLMISFAGMATYKNAESIRQVAAELPLDKVVIETDSPYLSPEPVRKIRRNEPAHVVHTCQKLAESRGESVE